MSLCELQEVEEAIMRAAHRTNNVSEGGHNRFRILIINHHPDFYSALTEFQKEQGDSENVLVKLTLGRSVKTGPKKKWLAVHKIIRGILLSLIHI